MVLTRGAVVSCTLPWLRFCQIHFGRGLGYFGRIQDDAGESAMGPIWFVRAGEAVPETEPVVEEPTACYEAVKEVLVHCHRAKSAPVLSNASNGFS